MKKYVLALFLLSLLTAGAFSFEAGANESSGRKIVTIVFDDSFSMDNENRYSNANYAIQAFISLLGEEDELYLVYMSDVVRRLQQEPGNYAPGLAVAIDLKNPQEGADQVRNNPWNGAGTPYGAIQTGYNELVSHVDTDPSVSYYLVVLSDGGFMDDTTNQIMIETAQVQAQFESFYQTLMPNQTHLNTYYLAIGAEAVPLTDRPEVNFHAQMTADGQSMIRAIGNMADEISGRCRLDAAEIAVPAANIVSFTSPLPLKSVAFLSQGREAQVSRVTGPDGAAYEMSRNVKLSPDTWNHDPSLFGNAILVESGGKNMPAGTYQVQFTSDVDPGSLTVMIEPAVECRLSVSYQGQAVSEEALGSILEGEPVIATGTIVEAGTDNPIDLSLLAEGTVCTLAYEVNGQVVQSAEGQQLELVLQGGESRLTGTLSMPGFLPKTADIRFSVDSVSYSVEASPERAECRQNELDGCEPIVFRILGNGEPLTEDAAERCRLEEPVIEGGSLEYSWTRQEDGSYLFRPQGATESVGEITVKTTIAGLPEIVTQGGSLSFGAQAVLSLAPKIEYAVEAEIPADSVRQNELDECEPIRFYLTADGVRLGAAEAAKHPLSEPVMEGGSLEYQWSFEETTGAYVFQPVGVTEYTGPVTVRTGCEELEAEGEAAFTVVPKIRYEITLLEGGGSVPQTALGGCGPFRFMITADGRKLSQEEVKALGLELTADFTQSGFFLWETGARGAGFRRRVSVAEDGTYVCQPSGISWYYGEVQLTLSLAGEASCSAGFTVEGQPILYWIPITAMLVLLFLLICIIGWIRQPKFRNQIMEIVVYTRYGTGIQESPRIKVMKRSIGLIPYRACRMRVGDLVFTAADNGRILADKDSVRGRIVYSGKVRFMGKSAGNMNRLLRMMEPVKRDIRMIRGMELYVASDKNSEAITGYRITSS